MQNLKKIKNLLIKWSPLSIKKYILAFPVRNQLINTIFPSQVWIEDTNFCNAHCVMCPRDKLVRKRGFMDFALYEKLIYEIAHYRDIVKRVHLVNFGEPLLDKRLADKIKLAKSLRIKHTYFVTNASLFTPDISRKIIESGIDEIKISFGGTDKETYNATMRGLDFDSIFQNVITFFKIREEMKSKTPKIIIQYIQERPSKNEIEKFRDIFNKIINVKIEDSLVIASLHNFVDGRNYCSMRNYIHDICLFPWKIMEILWDGTVVHCCRDYNGIQVSGNVTKNSIKEIWNGVVYRKLRHDFITLKYKNYPLCSRCSYVT